jgi:hypothetical protein
MNPLVRGECQANVFSVRRSEDIGPGDLILFDAPPLGLLIIHRCLEVGVTRVLVYPDRVRPDTRHSTNSWVGINHVLGIVDSIATLSGAQVYRRGSVSGQFYDLLALQLGRLSWYSERTGHSTLEAVITWAAPALLKAALVLCSGRELGRLLPLSHRRLE